MHSPQHQPQRDDLDELMEDIGKTLARSIASRDAGSSTQAAAPNPPPASSAGPAPGEKWGPSSQRAYSPKQLLATVADNAFELQGMIDVLVTEITGEEVPARPIRPAPAGNGLLPVLNHLACEIDQAHGDAARLIRYLRERVA
jgi:hypothetical protein